MKTLNRLPVKLGLTIFLSLTLLLNLQAQVTNGSFETIDNLADVSGWTAICTTVIGSIQDAAPGGGMWCAQTNSGNTQGCFPGYTYQVISAINDGERWKLEGWARIDTNFTPWTPIGIYFGIIDSVNNITLLFGDTTSSSFWTFLSMEDTIFLSPGESAVVVLDAGLTGGPANGLAYFDLLSAQKAGVINSVFAPLESNGIRVTTYPNPFRNSTTIKFNNPVGEPYTLILYNSQGRLVRTIENIKTGQTVIERKNLLSGCYFFQLHTGGRLSASGKLTIE